MNRLKKTVTLLFFILNHYALMLRYFMMPKKNQRYANGQRWFYPVRCNYFLAEPASNKISHVGLRHFRKKRCQEKAKQAGEDGNHRYSVG